jgi:hypothetical protein
MQGELVRWARSHADSRLHLLFHIPNGGARSGYSGGQMVALGARTGVPDLFLPVPHGGLPGLWIEMKTPTGVVSPTQRRWLAALAEQGYATAVCRSVDEAQATLLRYLSPRLGAA